MNAFKQAEQAELAAMKELREKNTSLEKKVSVCLIKNLRLDLIILFYRIYSEPLFFD